MSTRKSNSSPSRSDRRPRASLAASSTWATSSGDGPAAPGHDVGAVDGEGGDQLPDRLVQLMSGVVAVAAVPLADFDGQVGQPVDLRREHLGHHEVLLLVDDLVPVDRLAGEGGVGLAQRLLAGGVDEEAADPVDEVVAGRARHRPRRREPLAGLEDLLHHHPGVGAGLACEAAQVALRVAQAVGMVDAQPVHHAPVEPGEDQLMGVEEDRLVLHAQGGQGVDVEEPAVVELPPGGAPEGQPVVLPLQQGVEPVGVGVDAPPPRRRRRPPRPAPPAAAGPGWPAAPPCRGGVPGRWPGRSGTTVAAGRRTWPGFRAPSTGSAGRRRPGRRRATGAPPARRGRSSER